MFKPKLVDDNNQAIAFDCVTSKVVCVGRNYREHAKELNNRVPKSPVLFIKPNSCLVDVEEPICLPSHLSSNTHLDLNCHHELELCLLIGKTATRIEPENALSHIAGFGLGLDLTLRDLQSQLKAKGHPWEKAKAFDGACPMSHFYQYNHADCAQKPSSTFDLGRLDFSLKKNGKIVQQGNTADMIFAIEPLLAEISQYFSLLPGDIIMTGTPAGVSQLQSGDKLELYLQQALIAKTSVNA